MTDLLDALGHLKTARVLCVGDVMLDRFVYGSVERMSAEAPIPVLSVQRETAMLGGAGNVVRNLVALGAHICFVSVVGDDTAGREVIGLIGAEASVESHLLIEQGRPTTIKTRMVAGSQQLLRADHETVRDVRDSIAADVLRRAEAGLADHPLMVLSDYGKGVLRADLVPKLIAAARAVGAPVVIDPKSRDFSRYAGATVLKPNRRELQDATGMPVETHDEVVAAARRVLETIDIAAVLVTRSQHGMTLVPRDGAVAHFKAEAHEVYDVSGAGDTVAATIAAAISGGVALADACRIASLAAGIVVAKTGTAVCHLPELEAALHARDRAEGDAKIASRDSAIAQAAAWRHAGLSIGFTNGCFDLLHPGHIALLKQARAACDRLVVGINTDASVKRLKGPERPIQSEVARATVLASMASVDLVVPFGEDTPFELIRDLRPDVLVKGSDYRVDQVVGADLVQAAGGRVLLAELVPGHSTTRTIQRMAG